MTYGRMNAAIFSAILVGAIAGAVAGRRIAGAAGILPGAGTGGYGAFLLTQAAGWTWQAIGG